MNVYTLSETSVGSMEEYLIGIYDTAKSARRAFDMMFGINTRKKWKKINKYCRKYNRHYITEWKVESLPKPNVMEKI